MTRIAAFLGLFTAGFAFADHFDDHNLAVLRTVPAAKTARKAIEATAAQLTLLPHAIEGTGGSAFLIVKTDDGNWCKLLVRQGALKLKGKTEPILWIERLVTYSADSRRGVKADRRDVYLFDGFGVDLDIGQIVPKGGGEDLVFHAERKVSSAVATGAAMDGQGMASEPAGAALKGKVSAAEGAELYLVAGSLVQSGADIKPRRPASGAVAASDFAGSFHLDADGRWTGVLALSAEQGGKITGTFTSEQTGNAYTVSGQAGSPSNHLLLKVQFPRTELELDGYLWSRDRQRIAGAARIEDKAFGFQAQRVK